MERYVCRVDSRACTPLGEDLDDFPVTRVRGQPARLVWIGDPGVGEVALTWREGSGSCRWHVLTLSSTGKSQKDAESALKEVAASVR
jgi:hypothetical protein